jgi:hypothetical protein
MDGAARRAGSAAMRDHELAIALCLIGALAATGCAGGGGGHHGGGGGGGGGGNGGPAYTATLTHQGNFTQGQQNATYAITLTNIGGNFVSVNGATFSAGVQELIPPGLTLVSMSGMGWTCSLGPSPGCTTTNPIAAGASAPLITVTVNVAANATSPLINQVSYPGPACPNCPTVSDSTTILPGQAGPPVVGTSVPFPIFAGDPATAIPITLNNDAAGDVVTAQLTVDANTGTACTAATCGTLGPVTGTSGSGSYTVSYTPPAAAGFTTQIVPTLIVHSSLAGSFDDTDYIEVDPPGQPLVTLSGVGGLVLAGSPQITLAAAVYNDVTHAGVTFPSMTASGYGCASLMSNTCGTLGTPGAPSVSGNTTTVTIPYTPPAAVPTSPYDRPRVMAVSAANNTQFAFSSFHLSSSALPATALRIPPGQRFLTAPTGGAAIQINANIGNDTGSSRTVTWALSCAPTCGTLGTPVASGNGTFVSSSVTYTAPSTLPGGAAQTATITATSVDSPAATDSFTFTVVDGSCGSGSESVLNGQYAFLLRGGGSNPGYAALIGSFTADGAGHIIAGLVDANVSNAGPFTGMTLAPASSSYSIGSDHRVCMTLTDNAGDIFVLRAGVGALASGVAKQGRMILFRDVNGRQQRLSGILLKQDTSAFAASQISGTYALGLAGVDASGGRLTGAGLITADGAGKLSAFTADFDDAGTASGNLTGGSGTYAVGANGRGTVSTTLNGPGGAATTNGVVYVVSASQALVMSTDSVLAGKSITSGELRKQTGTFTATSLDNAGYVFYTTGIDAANGGNVIRIGQATVGTNGSATLTVDVNDNGVAQAEQTGALQLTIAANGRTTFTGVVAGNAPDVLYLVDSTSGFLVGTSSEVHFGYLEKQSGGPFSNSSLNGAYFFGSDAPNTGAKYTSGTVTLDGAGNINGNGSYSSPSGLGANIISPSSGGTYSFSSSTSPVGKGTVSTGAPAYVISGSKLVFVSEGQQPSLVIGQQ